MQQKDKRVLNGLCISISVSKVIFTSAGMHQLANFHGLIYTQIQITVIPGGVPQI